MSGQGDRSQQERGQGDGRVLPGIERALELVVKVVAVGTAVVGVWFYVAGAEAREKQAQYEAWQVIAAAHGQASSGGRVQALEDLNEAGVNLSGVALEGANLPGLDLAGAQMNRTNLNDTDLYEADLCSAALVDANMEGTTLYRADIRGADLCCVDLRKGGLIEVDGWGAGICDADLREARLDQADLRGATLTGAELDGADLTGANLEGAEGLTQGQIDGAQGDATTRLPDGFEVPLDWDPEEADG